MYNSSSLLAAIRNTLPYYEVLTGKKNQRKFITNRFLMESESKKEFDYNPKVSLH